MQPRQWHPPVALSAQEKQIVQRRRRAKLCVLLRHHRHELFDEAFQQALANLYRPSKRRHAPIAPAQVALAIILQAYTGVSDDEVRDRNAHGSARAFGVGLSGHRSGPMEPRNMCCFSQASDRCVDGSTTHRTDD